MVNRVGSSDNPTSSPHPKIWILYDDLLLRLPYLQVIGDTWETYPELKLKALQHMHQYMVGLSQCFLSFKAHPARVHI